MPDSDIARSLRNGTISQDVANSYGFGDALAADPTLGQLPTGLGEYLGHAAGNLYNRLMTGPRALRASWERGQAGDIPTTEEQIPSMWTVANQATGMGSPFSQRGALGSAGGKLFTPEGLPIKGSAFTKQSQKMLKEVEEAGKGTGPLDLASQAQIPNIAQTGLERYAPPRGVSKRLEDALVDPRVIAGVKDSIEQGKAMGADKWYHTEPLRQAFAKEFAGSNSDPGGARAFQQFMDKVAATSPRSDVPTNIRNASYYYGLARRGEDLPETLPYPYGHVAQNLHRQNFANLSAAAAERPGSGWNVLQNPKPASFAQNLTGNLEPVTVDTHAFRNIGMRTEDPRFLATSIRSKIKKTGSAAADDEAGAMASNPTMVSKYGEVDPKDPSVVTFRPRKLFNEGKLSMADAKNIPSFWDSKPTDNEYAAVENFYRQLAREHGLAPADAQAAAWAGGGKLTGLGSPPAKTFPEMFNERVAYTARMRGEDPKDTLRKMIRGQAPLLGLAGTAAALAAGNRRAEAMGTASTAGPETIEDKITAANTREGRFREELDRVRARQRGPRNLLDINRVLTPGERLLYDRERGPLSGRDIRGL
jgi:hypothetical protein